MSLGWTACIRAWVCHGRSGFVRKGSNSRWEARSHPLARPSRSYPLYPEKKTSPAQVQLSQDDEQIQVIAFGGADPELQPHAPDQFVRRIEAARKDGATRSIARLVRHVALGGRRLPLQPAGIRAEMEEGRPHGSKGPTLLGADVLLVERLSDLEADPRESIHPVVDVLQEMVQEALLPEIGRASC